MATKRIQIIVDEDFLNDIDDCAKKVQLSRSAFMNMCCANTMLLPNGFLSLKGKKELIQHFNKYAQSVIDAENEIE